MAPMMRKRRWSNLVITVLLGCCVALFCLFRIYASKAFLSSIANYVKGFASQERAQQAESSYESNTTLLSSPLSLKATFTSPVVDLSSTPTGPSLSPVHINSPSHVSAEPANVGLSPLLTRLNATQIKEYFEINPLTDEQIPHLFPKLDIHDYDTVAIYSRSNWLKLRTMLTEGNVTLFVNGGSSLTGVGLFARHEECCQYPFARLFHNMSVVDGTHGGCSSFHATQLMHSYFPRHADVLLWEFAVNDIASNIERYKHQLAICQKQLVLYFEQLVRVSRLRQQDPPIVIMLYLWDPPFHVVHGRIAQTVYQAHRDLVERYDFVAGHVNAAKYLESWNVDESKTVAIALADYHHPNFRGQQIIYYLLKDFIMNEHRPDKPKSMQEIPQLTSWGCATTSPEQQVVRDLVIHRYPVASYTEETPKNKELLHGMLASHSTKRLLSHNRKKELPLRRDRKKCVILPCCHVANITFQVALYCPLQGLQATWSGYGGPARVYVDDEDFTNTTIPAHSWPCTSDRNWWGDQQWIILKEERNVSQISICSPSPNCSTVKRRHALGLMSLVLYGGNRM